MISFVELLAVTALAVALAQCVARLVRMVPSQMGGTPSVPLTPKAADHAAERSFWGETTRAHFYYVRRRTRYQVNCPVRYEIEGKAENGAVVDMSREGWRIKGGGNAPVGTEMSLTISLPSGVAPATVSRAVVRWSDGTEFGIGLIALDPGSAVELSEFFSTLTPVPRADLPAA
jgi:hypothetical protein